MSSERAPSVMELIRRAIDARLLQLHTSFPARVETYDGAKQMVSVKPLVKQAYRDESDERQVESLPVIAGVPVLFPGANGCRLTMPIAPGDTGLVMVSERSLDRWLSGQGQEVDPEIDHAHALADAVFLPGLRPFGNPLASAPTDHATLGYDSGPQIHLRSATITIGDESGAQFVALANLVNAELTKIATTIASLSGASFTSPYSRSAVDATQAKAK